MNYREACNHMRTLDAAGIRLGLDAISRALERLDNPQKQLRTVHVAGTNGKGSAARMVQSIMTAAGYRTGLFATPAVGEDRFAVTLDGEPMPESAFADCLTAVAAEGDLTAFESLTAVAMLYFAEQRADLCVLECGMGGLTDATNVIPSPLAAVLTPIAMDHAAFLGNTVEAIAAQKCGILKPGSAVICSPDQSEAALGVILEAAAKLGLTVRIPGGANARLLRRDWGRIEFLYNGEDYTLPMGGDFQIGNALTAVETAAALREKGYTVDPAAVKAGLAAAALPCRQEAIRRDPLILLDGAHNPHAVEKLAETVAALKGETPLTLLCGMLRDKDTAACIRLLAPHVEHIVCCTPPVARGLPAMELAAQSGRPDALAADTPEEGLRLARELAGSDPLVIAGSFYLAGYLRKLLLAEGC